MPDKKSPRGTTGRITTEKSTASRRSSEEKTQKTSASNDGVVTLPNRVSSAARKRERMLRAELDGYLQKSMYRIAYTVGFCFILVGSAYTIVPQYTPVQWQTASSFSSVDGSETIATNVVETTQSEPSEFTFLTTIPNTVTETLVVYFEITNTLDVVASLKAVGTSNSISLPIEQVSDTKYRTIIRPELLTSNHYRLFVHVKPLDDSGTYVRSTEEFFVGHSDNTNSVTETAEVSELTFLTSVPNNVVQDTKVDFQVTHAENIAVKMTMVGVVGFIDMPLSELLNDRYRTTIETKRFSPGYYQLLVFIKPLDGSKTYSRVTNEFFIGSEEVEDWYNSRTKPKEEIVDENLEINDSSQQTEEEKTTVIEKEPEAPTVVQEPVFSLVPPQENTLTETVTIQLLTPTNASTIELYARQLNSLSARYVATAIKRQDSWVIVFDSKNFPNGDYEFFARTQYAGKNLVTKSLQLSIRNTIKAQTQVLPQEPDRFTEIVSFAPEQTTLSSTIGIDDNVRNIIGDDTIGFEELFRRYAVAQQTGDESLIRIAQDELVKARERVYLGMIADQSDREIADKVAMELQEKVEDIKDRVDTFETLRHKRTAGESALDSDADGISDLDEIHLYGTDPHSADTDGDGIPDGVEIMRGLDPLVPDAEVVIRYESPKELLGLARPDVLEIKEILPVVQEQVDEKSVLVASEIRGRALPNSFVTLFIFSTPTVVTVKTDPDGTFVYTYDKELEDGQHDVYVAVTDNTGKIIAHSNRFSFVKEAQAFTPVDAAESDVITTATTIEMTNKNAYSTTLGIAVLAFGLILLMLGISIRKGHAVVDEETVSADSQSNTDEEEVSAVTGQVKYVSQRKEHIDAS